MNLEIINILHMLMKSQIWTKFAKPAPQPEAVLFSFAIVQMFSKFSKQCLVKDICLLMH